MLLFIATLSLGIVHYDCVYMIVLSRVQLTSGPRPSSNPPNGCGLSQFGLQSGLGAFTLEAESRLELSCKRGLCLTLFGGELHALSLIGGRSGYIVLFILT